MSSDRDKLDLINRIRNGEPYTVHEEAQIVEKALAQTPLPQIINSATFDYNPDGTLREAVIGEQKLKFMWNADGTLHKVNTYRR